MNSNFTSNISLKHLKKRHAADRRFKYYGIFAIILSVGFLVFLLSSVVSKGYTAFVTTEIRLTIDLQQSVLDPNSTSDLKVIRGANYKKLIRDSLLAEFPDVTKRRDKRKLFELVSNGADINLRNYVLKNIHEIGGTIEIWVSASSDLDMLMKGYISRDAIESRRKIKNKQLEWIDYFDNNDSIRTVFNSVFFTNGDSRNPEQAGMLGSIVGSLFTILVCMLCAFPVAVLTAIYLEEFAVKNLITDLIEVNINNLAAVPSIVFGLLGLAVFLNFFGMPRSSSVVGGITLALMVLPTIVITTRNALKAVPPSIREGAMALGASPIQVLVHHTVPLALPGIMTGTILAVARALGETAPLLMIGMVAFIVDVPTGLSSPATTMPVQIYLWSDSPEMGFVERTYAVIMVLLAFLLLFNALAIFLRKKFEVRW
jgi:phosphate transport system permease protein